MADAVLAILVLGPALITYVLKSNAALGFLTVCASFVLSTSVIGDLKNLLSQINLSTADSTIGLVLLIVPVALTLLLTKRSAGKGIKFWLHMIAALAAGGLLALSVGPILTSSTQFNIAGSKFWNDLQKAQSVVIGGGALLSFILLWFGGLKRPSKKHKL